MHEPQVGGNMTSYETARDAFVERLRIEYRRAMEMAEAHSTVSLGDTAFRLAQAQEYLRVGGYEASEEPQAFLICLEGTLEQIAALADVEEALRRVNLYPHDVVLRAYEGKRQALETIRAAAIATLNRVNHPEVTEALDRLLERSSLPF